MSKIIVLCLGLTILAIFLPNQVVSDNTTVAAITLNNTTPNGNSTSLSLSTNTANTTIITTKSYASSVYAAPTIFLGFATVSLLTIYC
ncbi:hypothetical protein XELAEV_18029307mg [Xenopus laevis]|uniref:Uncharacterized protein n=1 Tax=Xenopus laevis TaxID=8355 RepID=A0A974HHK0_XENLA|nr:hypothetical protein XELAEV_18029307mg [Xenopus laevis]